MDYKIKDLGLADFGRKEIELAEQEMPGLMALRTRYKGKQPLKGARITGSLHMTIQTAVLIETLQRTGCRCKMGFLQYLFYSRPCAAAIAAAGIPVFAWKEKP